MMVCIVVHPCSMETRYHIQHVKIPVKFRGYSIIPSNCQSDSGRTSCQILWCCIIEAAMHKNTKLIQLYWMRAGTRRVNVNSPTVHCAAV